MNTKKSYLMEGKMNQLGNLAIVCARRPDVLLQILNGKATVYIGYGPDKTTLSTDWDDNERISEIVRELNFGKYIVQKKEV